MLAETRRLDLLPFFYLAQSHFLWVGSTPVHLRGEEALGQVGGGAPARRRLPELLAGLALDPMWTPGSLLVLAGATACL